MSTLDGQGTDGPSLVVTGSSAGGIEALSAFVSGLPLDFPAPIVVAQHLDPNQQSRLGEILGARSPLPVVVVREREVLAPATIYVVPAGYDVEVNDGDVQVSRVKPDAHARPSVDRLFTTAAAAYGDRLIGVILSGMGSDGVVGARAVKERGGTIVIQEPSSASYPSMPLALAATLVDVVAKPSEIGPLLRGVLTQEHLKDDSTESVLGAFLTQLRDRSGIDFLQYKMPTIRRRLSRLMASAGSENLREYTRYLQQHPEAYQRLVSTFLIKVTGFFRDPALFEYLREHLIPQLIEEARGRDRELRLWSAGCATGEEAYSLAIVIAELLRDNVEGFDVRIFATDLDEEAIAFARRGAYPPAALENVPADLIERYFVRTSDAFEVGKRIRNMTVFGQHDLGQRAPFPRIDLVLCRNVLIYFTRELQQRTIQLFGFSIRENGYLVLGKAEMTSPEPQFFKPVHTLLKVFRRQGERAMIPTSHMRETLGPLPPASPRARVPASPASPSRSAEPRPTFNGLIGALVFNSQLGIVIVDRRYDIVTINAAARAMLDIHGVGVGEDFIHLVRNVHPNALREIIDAALRNELVEFGREIDVRTGAGDEERSLQIACYPDKSSGARVEGAMLVFMDTTTTLRRSRELEQKSVAQEAKLAALTARMEEVTQRQRALLAANDELTTTNVDLRSTNEQLLIASEEAASATEEIETLNEEMQATNEELETLNEELQATIEELNTTNDELEARGGELETLGELREQNLVEAEEQRDRLAAAFNALDEPTAILDPHGAVLFENDTMAAVRGNLVVRVGDRSFPMTDAVKLFAEAGDDSGIRATARTIEDLERRYTVRRRTMVLHDVRLYLLVLKQIMSGENSEEGRGRSRS